MLISGCLRLSFCQRLKLCQKLVASGGLRQLSGDKQVPVAYQAVSLQGSRSLISLKGQDSLSLLQGLITNDVQLLEEEAKCVYALFLNHQGRVLWDSLVFKAPEQDKFWVEVDHRVRDKVVKHLKIFRLRKKVEIGEEQGLEVWAAFGNRVDEEKNLKKEPAQGDQCCAPVSGELPPLQIDPALKCFPDPRLSQLGWRVLVPSSPGGGGDAGVFRSIPVLDETSYQQLRYRLGVAEGTEEIPSGASFPLESNADYLHGVSFQKGCYIGQELTARTHHTGVIRKRVMPFRLPEASTSLENQAPETLQIINSTTNKSVGKVRAISGTFGIGLIRVEEALSASPGVLKIGDVPVTIQRPAWWPLKTGQSDNLKN